MTLFFALFLLVSSSPRLSLCDVVSVAHPEDLCSLCECYSSTDGQGEQRDEAACRDLGDLVLSASPPLLSRLVVSNATSVKLERGSVRVAKEMKVEVEDVGKVAVEEKALTLLNKKGRLHLKFKNAGKLTLASRSVSAQGGHLDVSVERVDTVVVEKQAFDVLQTVNIRDVNTLRLSQSAFKPNILGESLDLDISLSNVASLPSLPSNVFTSSKSINVTNCVVGEIAPNAFSGNTIMNVKFEGSSVERILRQAFPGRTYIGTLSFDSCTLKSVATRAVESGVSSLTLSNNLVSSISVQGFRCQVARVAVVGNTFQTLGNSSLVLGTWNEFTFNGNSVKFMDGGALLGVASPIDEGNVSLSLSNNTISYANRNALLMSLPQRVSANVEGNVFERECSCEISTWLDYVCGKVDEGDLDLTNLTKASSQCQVEKSFRKCFDNEELVLIPAYHEKLCVVHPGQDANAQFECSTGLLDEIWDVLRSQLQMETNKGILLTILLFAIMFSLLLSIYTLIRWIIYTLQIRSKTNNEDEWNFTKIEERQIHTPSPIDHYESLMPRGQQEEEEASMETSSGSNAPRDQTVSEDVDNSTTLDRASLIKKEEEEEPEGAKSKRVSRAGADAMPKMTFYDEMIDLLKEKLDDPDNYATVADTRNAALYQDPFDIQPDSNAKSEEKA